MDRQRLRVDRPTGPSMSMPLMPTIRHLQQPTSRHGSGVRNNDVDTMSSDTGSSAASNQLTGSRSQQSKRRRKRSSSSPRLRPYGDGTHTGGNRLSNTPPASSSPSTTNSRDRHSGRGRSSSGSGSFSGSDDGDMPLLRAYGGRRGDDEAPKRRRRSPPPLMKQTHDMGPDFWKALMKWSSRGAGDGRRDGIVDYNDDDDDRRTASTSGSGDGDAMTGEDRQRWFEYFISMYKYNKEQAEAKRRRRGGSNSPMSPPRLSPETTITRESRRMGLLPTPPLNSSSLPSLLNLDLSVPRGWINKHADVSSSGWRDRHRDDDDDDPEPRRRKKRQSSRARSTGRDCSPDSKNSSQEKQK